MTNRLVIQPADARFCDGVININNKGFEFTASGAGGTFTLINQGTINAEAETFFLKDEKIEIIETPVDIIIFTPSQGQIKTVNLDSFATSETKALFNHLGDFGRTFQKGTSSSIEAPFRA